jgi:hypothetical protein
MGKIFRVRWTVIPRFSPQPWIACTHCGGLKPFRSSGKIRLNANGKTLDAWLIYKCVVCGSTWNRPIFERRTVRDVDRATLAALHANDANWIRRMEFDIAGLRRKSSRIDACSTTDVQKRVLERDSPDWTVLAIELAVPLPTGLRLDHLLATELCLPRPRLHALHEKTHLRIEPPHKHALRRGAKDGQRVVLDLSGEPDLRAACEAANGI